MRYAAVALTMMALLCLGASAFANEFTSLPMHAIVTSYGLCITDDPCPAPTTDVSTGDQIAAYLLVRNYDNVAGVQTAFQWGNWAFMFGLWDCQANQVSGVTPTPPGGETAGTIATAFDCISGGATAVVGRMHLIPSDPGCIIQLESSYPFGTHVVDCQGNVQHIMDDVCLGRICASTGQGRNSCDPCDAMAVEPSTWGTIKLQYN